MSTNLPSSVAPTNGTTETGNFTANKRDREEIDFISNPKRIRTQPPSSSLVVEFKDFCNPYSGTPHNLEPYRTSVHKPAPRDPMGTFSGQFPLPPPLEITPPHLEMTLSPYRTMLTDEELRNELEVLRKRTERKWNPTSGNMKNLVLEICRREPKTSQELRAILFREKKSVSRYVKDLSLSGELVSHAYLDSEGHRIVKHLIPKILDESVNNVQEQKEEDPILADEASLQLPSFQQFLHLVNQPGIEVPVYPNTTTTTPEIVGATAVPNQPLRSSKENSSNKDSLGNKIVSLCNESPRTMKQLIAEFDLKSNTHVSLRVKQLCNAGELVRVENTVVDGLIEAVFMSP